ncbi:unnamed protein product [Camellia sinensis]
MDSAEAEYAAFEEKVRRTVSIDNLSPQVTEAVLKTALNQSGNVDKVQLAWARIAKRLKYSETESAGKKKKKETIYRTSLEIPHNPKEPWDSEMEYDDTLTPEIPTEQLPDPDGAETVVSLPENEISTVVAEMPASSTSQISNGSVPEPDLELLAVLRKKPGIGFFCIDVRPRW